MDEDYLYSIASGLGGGIGSLGEACGAVTGGALALGRLYGPGKDRSPEDKAAIYARVREYVEQFQAANGAVRCQDLLGVDLNTETGKQAYREQNLNQRCRAYVRSGVETLEKLARKG